MVTIFDSNIIIFTDQFLNIHKPKDKTVSLVVEKTLKPAEIKPLLTKSCI